MIDLIVIGAGLSGLTAALAAAEAGLRVKVVSKGLNALHWSAATLDLLGYTPPRATPIREPWATLPRLSLDHPYQVAGAERAAAAVQRFVGWTTAAGLPYAGGTVAGENFMLPSPVGAMRPVYMAPQGQHGGDLSSEQPLLIAGFAGARDFYPHLLAEHLVKQGRAARAVELPTSLITQRRDANTVQLAAELDKVENHSRLGAALKAACPKGIDVLLENASPEHLCACLPLMNLQKQVIIAGFVGTYNLSSKIALPENFEYVLDRFLTIQSYPFMDSLDRYDEFVADMIRWRSEGRMHLEEVVYEGLENAPTALCALLDGKHIGKPLVRLSQ